LGVVIDRSSSSILPLLARTGAIRPPDRFRFHLALNLTEREEISRGLIGQSSVGSIARTLRGFVSTISREVRRNGGRAQYRAAQFEKSAWDRTHRTKSYKLAGNVNLCRVISAELMRK
jgi:IS30 family transposase